MDILLVGAALLLAFVNGANDNLKGVATLYGSGTLSYRACLILATLSTGAGALLSVILAAGLANAFSAKGLVPDALLDAGFLSAVSLAAAITVLIATRLGMPISTTHAILGGLGGAGLVGAGNALDVSLLASKFALPLLVGPILAVAIAKLLWTGAGRPLEQAQETTAAAAAPVEIPSALRAVSGHILSFSRVQLHALHVLSGAFVGFARGLNDTPKIVGLLLGAAILDPLEASALVATTMAVGGLVAARRVTRTLALEITPLEPTRGLVANATTSLLVAAASFVALPVSTTHVSTGGIVGIGGATGSLRWRATCRVLGAWVITVPLAAAIGALAMWGLS